MRPLHGLGLLVPLLVSSTKVDFEVCGGATDGLGIQSIDLDPFPAVAGRDLLISVEGTSAVAVEEGTTVVMEIREGPLPAAPATYNLCEALLRTSNRSCPVPPGTTSAVQLVYTVPRVAPAGTATSTVTTRNAQGDQISCITLHTPVVRDGTAAAAGITAAAVSLLGNVGRVGEGEEEGESQAEVEG